MKLKLLGGAILFGMALWFGWWWLAASAHQTALHDWLAQRRAAGWQAEAADITVAGFPNRLDTTITKPALADPASGWAWEAPFLLIQQIIYDPTAIIVSWPQTQTIAAPGARGTLTTEVMHASLSLSSSQRLEVERASLEIRGAALSGVEEWRSAVASWVHHIRLAPNAGPDNAYEFRADGAGFTPPDAWRDLIDPAGALPVSIESIAMEGRIAFDRPLDRYALEGAKPQVTALTLKEAQVAWGGLSLSVTGSLRADANGYAEGDLQIDARKWREMVDAAEAAGALPSAAASSVKAGLSLIARLSGDKDRISAPLSFSNGYTRMGPVPIGPAPKLVN